MEATLLTNRGTAAAETRAFPDSVRCFRSAVVVLAVAHLVSAWVDARVRIVAVLGRDVSVQVFVDTLGDA